jgi:late competence protein required for DNA uptake (superfamily II DNA/RNA helicase)
MFWKTIKIPHIDVLQNVLKRFTKQTDNMQINLIHVADKWTNSKPFVFSKTIMKHVITI